MRLNKEKKYLDLAHHFAKVFSKDKSTQVGALFLHPSEYTILSAGYNGIPRGCIDDEPYRQTRPIKYEYYEHAERNAIYNIVRDIFRGTLLICTAPLDIEDVRALISVGVSRLAVKALPPGETASILLKEAGVTLTAVPLNMPDNVIQFMKPNEEPVPYAELEEPKTIQSVRQVIFAAARPLLEGSTIVVAPLPPCAQCAQALVAVGVKKVISYSPTADQQLRWGNSFDQSRDLFEAQAISLVELPSPA